MFSGFNSIADWIRDQIDDCPEENCDDTDFWKTVLSNAISFEGFKQKIVLCKFVFKSQQKQSASGPSSFCIHLLFLITLNCHTGNIDIKFKNLISKHIYDDFFTKVKCGKLIVMDAIPLFPNDKELSTNGKYWEAMQSPYIHGVDTELPYTLEFNIITFKDGSAIKLPLNVDFDKRKIYSCPSLFRLSTGMDIMDIFESSIECDKEELTILNNLFSNKKIFGNNY